MPPPELFSESPDGKPCNLITRENYEYLRGKHSINSPFHSKNVILLL